MNKFKHPILILFLSSFIFIPIFFHVCRDLMALSFDYQEFITWDYLSSIKSIPYRDFYYPYGLIDYLKDHYSVFFVSNLFIIPLVLTVIFTFFKKLFVKTSYSYLFFFSFLIFVISSVDLNFFQRYGIMLSSGILLSMNFLQSGFKNKFSFIFGILSGLIFSLIYDQGMYMILLFFVSVSIFSLTEVNIKINFKTYLFLISREIIAFLVGLFLVVVPFGIILNHFGMLSGFMSNIITINDIAQYAKAPFFNSFVSIENLYITLSIFLSTIYLVYKLFYLKNTKGLAFRSIFITWFSILILEQKNILRSIDSQLVFFSFFIFLLLFCEIFNYFKKQKVPFKSYVILFLTFILISISFFKIDVSRLTQIYSINISGLGKNIRECSESNKSNLIVRNPQYNEVKNRLESYPDFNGRVYSFPGDPFFYVVLNQKPPYYSAIYQASPLYAQHRIIDFLENDNIKYVIYNTSNFRLQDAVPNYVRVATLHKYIINNYIPKESVGNFLILEKKEGDFFVNNDARSLREHLLNIDLENIPKSEGIYKGDYLAQGDENIAFNSLEEVNKYLGKNNINSKNKIFFIKFNKSVEESSADLSIVTGDRIKTKILFKGCSPKFYCLINLSNVPLFYKNRVISEVLMNDPENIREINITTYNSNSYFW